MSPVRIIAYQGRLLRVGVFRCPTDDPDFSDSGPIRSHLVVFPRTSVTITHAGSEPIIASPNVVMFYNQGQAYRREAISERGDLCEWYAFHPQILLDALRTYDPAIEEHSEQPFQLSWGPCNPASYLQQRLVFRHIGEAAHPDPLYIEETMLCVLQHLLEQAYQKFARRAHRAGAQEKHYEEITRAVQQLLATRFQERLTLGDIAAEINYSPYHLAHIFRHETGLTLGFSSHSHFTQAFRRAFGALPSQLRLPKTPAFHP
jgi:AraC family transcriptional regulator